MAINKNNVFFSTYQRFNEKKLSADKNNTTYTVGISGDVQMGSPDILWDTVVYIKETKLIWTHHEFFGSNNDKYSIPIYDQLIINLLEEDGNLPENFILISTPNDLNGEITNNIYTTNNGTYLDILFNAVRKLQSEVTKLKNTFYYGICSETEGNTSSNNIILSTEEEEKEPLWAIDPEDLEELDDSEITIDENCGLIPTTGWSYSSNKNYILINNSLVSSRFINIPENLPKIIFYSIVEPISENWNFLINFKNNKSIDISSLVSPLKISILFIISNRIIKENNTTYNKNFYWINICNSNGDSILQKYFDENFNLTDKEQDIDEIDNFTNISLRNLKLYRFKVYTKELSFNNTSNILPEKTESDDFVFKAAHITLRSVSSYELLIKVKDRLYNNELVYCGDPKKSGLYIKYENKLISLSTSNTEDKLDKKFNANIKLNFDEISLKVDEIIKLVATTNSDSRIIFATEDSNIIELSESGIIKAISPGVASITISVKETDYYLSEQITCNVIVLEKDPEIEDPDDREDDKLNWEFGNDFPIIFDNNIIKSWEFGNNFPIILK